MDFYVGIASYKRPDESSTLDYLDKLGFPVERRIMSVQTQEDREAYERSGLSKRVGVFLYREASTAAGNRNTILMNMKEGSKVVLMDDDIRRVVVNDCGLVPVDTGAKFNAMCETGFNLARKHKTVSFGLYPVANAYFMRQEYRRCCVTIATLMGLTVTAGLRFCEELRTKEDYELCCRIIRRYGACIRLDNYACEAKHKSKGGCEEAWKDTKGNRAIAELLCAKYPDILRNNPRRPGEVLMVQREKRSRHE